MKKQKAIFAILLLSFLIGLGMISTGLASLPPPYEKSETVILNPKVNDIIKNLQPQKMVDEETLAAQKPKPKVEDNVHDRVIRRGETLAGVIENYGVGASEVNDAIAELSKHYSMKQIRAGETVHIELLDKNGKHIKMLSIKPNITKTIELTNEKGEFKVKVETAVLEKVLLKARGEISGSFYQSAVDAGVTPSVVSQLIAALSYDVDFQRDIQPGHKFTILFEGLTDEDGEFVKSTRPLYVKLEMKKHVVEMYIVPQSNGTLGYFHADGSNAKKALLRTPIDGARITSGFGMRMHPILGYTKMHKGIDFGAPQGTPIYAAGDGVIETASWVNGYGNFVVIKHNETYETAYGHTSRFGAGIKPGVHVHQGQIIAYVGMTGHATGPHLHYEIRVKGVQVNPAGVKLAIQDRMSGKDLARFKEEQKRIVAALSSAPTRAQLADLIKDEDETTTAPAAPVAPGPNAVVTPTAAPAQKAQVKK